MSKSTKSDRPDGLQTIADRERSLLALYAMHSADSLGRKYPEDEHPYRGPFQRDRDRIVHSAAYRRLSGKMQVFTGDMGDYHRTRLTHTYEVASIARTIARALRLNEDLVEALALFHDIGHPPFGHAGEDALNECLADEGGFSHNRHALVIAEELETPYIGFPGLNLSHEVLEGQRKRIDKSNGERRLLEVQLVDAADSITYNAHDTDDAVKLELVTLDELATNALVHRCMERVRERFGTSLDDEMLRKAVVHELIDCQVSNLLDHCGAALANLQNQSDVGQSDFVIGLGREMAEQAKELGSFLYDRVYRHEKLVEVREEAQRRLHLMFSGYVAKPQLLPQKQTERIETVGIARAVVEYLAGMTDRYCEEQYHCHFV